MEREILKREQQLSNIEKKIEGLRIGQGKKEVEKNEEKKGEVQSKTVGKKQVGDEAEGKEEVQRTPLYFFDQASSQWFIHPNFQQYFVIQLEIIQQLKETVNRNWSELQFKEYHRFLTDYHTYITKYIFGLQIPTFQDFSAWREAVKPYNPIGCELYQKQLDFIQHKYDFKSENKNKRDSIPPIIQQKKVEYKNPTYVLKQKHQKPNPSQPIVPKKAKKRYVQKSSQL